MKKIIWLFLAVIIVSCNSEPNDFVTIKGDLKTEGIDKLQILGNGFSKEISVNKDGSFSDTLKVTDGLHLISNGNDRATVFLRNGYDLLPENIDSTRSEFLPQDQLTTEEQFTEMAKEAEDAGFEGIMVRKNIGYEGKRSHNLLKVKKFHDAAPLYALSSIVAGSAEPSGRQTVPIDTDLSFFWRPYQRLTKPREKNTAENILVKIPKQCTTAKPRTGPEPKANRATPAIRVVMLESKIVAQARS